MEYDEKSDVAYCKFSYPYKSIHIRYADQELEAFEKRKYKETIQTLVHEMTHPLTDPFYDKAVQRIVTIKQIEDEREKLTDHIANIVLKNKLI